MKLSNEQTGAFSKKNCSVMSFPSLLNHSRTTPFCMTKSLLEVLPASNRVCLAGKVLTVCGISFQSNLLLLVNIILKIF